MSDTPRTDAAWNACYGHDEMDRVEAMTSLAGQLEREVEHWKRMYECAQNANAHRQAALEATPADDAPLGVVEILEILQTTSKTIVHAGYGYCPKENCGIWRYMPWPECAQEGCPTLELPTS